MAKTVIIQTKEEIREIITRRLLAFKRDYGKTFYYRCGKFTQHDVNELIAWHEGYCNLDTYKLSKSASLLLAFILD